ncbi:MULTISPECIES: hypothetical protein [Nostocales]|uniref:Uncharacterized protein n=1 Tax=Dolichospermum flos-aquae UHCC 0037 TaxID=2590026 RepID=A0ACC7SBL0_DOLFA|nr:MULTISPECIES: hypothetical protein [Nostocales]MBO1065151.1 hypothetical protein [Anabaena sp. 54]MTJ44867.1 hypothetical protein [Dolichospermum flos-aquae UHCC 0037]
MLTGVEARREAISKLYQAYKLLGDVWSLSECNVIYKDSDYIDPDHSESLSTMSGYILKHIVDVGMVDNVFFWNHIEEGSPECDLDLVEKYLMSEQENSIKPTGTEQLVETDANKSSTHGNVNKTQFRTVSELDKVQEKLKRMGM